MKCKPNGSDDIGCYSLSDLSTKKAPSTMTSLQKWLGSDWDGKIYVASTVSWKDEEFLQSGCSPNYNAGYWTLACCKHQMRSGGPFKELVSDYKRPTYVFTLAKASNRVQWLASVARVTKHFFSMKDYAAYVTKRGGSFASSRLSREFRAGSMMGWRFGDCHAKSNGKVGKPYQNRLKQHVHSAEHQWRNDCPEFLESKPHVILLSKKFILWKKPKFKAADVFKQSSYGHNVSHNNLVNMIEEFKD